MTRDILTIIEEEIQQAKKALDEIDEFYRKDLRILDRLSDAIADIGGSWMFITLFVLVLVSWVVTNSIILVKPYDPFPFILLNLFLSMIAAIQAPIILMSQKRAGQRDQAKLQMDLEKDIRDLHIDQQSHRILLQMQRDLAQIKKKMKIR